MLIYTTDIPKPSTTQISIRPNLSSYVYVAGIDGSTLKFDNYIGYPLFVPNHTHSVSLLAGAIKSRFELGRPILHLSLKRILWCFELSSGLKINFHKSCVVIVGKSVSNEGKLPCLSHI